MHPPHEHINLRRVFALLACSVLLFLVAGGQDTTRLGTVDVSAIKTAERIFNRYETAFIPQTRQLTSFPLLPFHIRKSTLRVEPGDVTKKVLLHFRLYNPADSSVTVCFFPGFYFRDITLYKILNSQLYRYPRILPEISDSTGYRIILLAARDTADILAELLQEKTYNNIISPRIINENYTAAFTLELNRNERSNNLLTYVFSGLLLMMILFSLASFFLGGNNEFLYYAGYAFMIGALLFTKSYFSYRSSPTSYFFESYFDFILQGIGICFYMLFMMYFLDTKNKHPFLYNLYKYSIAGLVTALFVYSFYHYETNNYYAENLVENSTKFILLALTIVFLVYSLTKWQDRLLRYLFWGNLALFIFSILSQLIIIAQPFHGANRLFTSALFYYEMGIFLELIFFLLGLTYKNRTQIIEQTREKERLILENERKELEKQLAVMTAHQEERNRISADMHDELGSGMTTIRLMSEIAKNKMKENVPVEIEKISQSANDVLNKMNAIIWSMNSRNDSLDNLISYIRSYSIEYFDGTDIECRVNTPPVIPDIELRGDKRRNIFLCVKETLNNVLKHSGAHRVNISISAEGSLVITIADDGKGIDLGNVREFGNGLNNIAYRMKSIGGEFHIENTGGTTTTIIFPLPPLT